MSGAGPQVCQILFMLGLMLVPPGRLASLAAFAGLALGSAAASRAEDRALLATDPGGEARHLERSAPSGLLLQKEVPEGASKPVLSIDTLHNEISLALARTRQLFKDMEFAAITAVVPLGVGFCVLFMCYSVNSRPCTARLCEEEEEEASCRGVREAGEAEAKEMSFEAEREEQPLLVIIALTSYRFHTGFLAATWVPFLIAKEAEILVPAQQTVFMGEQKLIYGMSLCFNPLFGLLSDKLSGMSRLCGRSTFLIFGVLLAGVGIYIAKIASDAVDVLWYLVASGVWMLGEAMADTTTEAVAPELIPAKQHDLASAVRSIQAFAGCLFGLLCIVVCRDVHFHWLYVAYVFMMVACGSATALLIRSVGSRRLEQQRLESFRWTGSLREAYIAPLQQSGNFALACLAFFCFSLGTAPVFFTLPMVRDLVGIADKMEQQTHFSLCSIDFLLCAVVSSLALVGGGGSGKEVSSPGTREDDRTLRWTSMSLCIIAYGIAALCYPLVGVGGSMQTNLVTMYCVSGCLGLSYGAVYSLVQTCTWSIVPEGANVANWMGVAALAKVTGCGIGNFLAGLILDQFRAHAGSASVAVKGYAVMSWFCAACVFLSAAVVRGLQRRVLAHRARGEAAGAATEARGSGL